MAPEVDVVTTTTLSPARAKYLLPSHMSLHQNDCDWRHTIVVEGESDSISGHLLSCPRTLIIEAGGVKPVGAAGARNIALWRTDAKWITNLDDDDALPPHSLDLRLAATTEDIGWVGGRMSNMLPDGEMLPWEQPCAPGMLAAGEALANWTGPGDPFPYHPSSLIMRTSLVQALGGWAALPQDEDIMMSAALVAVSPGIMLEDTVFWYRKHPDQWTAAGLYTEHVAEYREDIWKRAFILAQMRGVTWWHGL